MIPKTKVILVIVFVAIGLLGAKLIHKTPASSSPSLKHISDSVDIVQTSPPNLDGSTITPSENISFTFNYPVVNKDEFRSSITPAIDYTIKLSDDRKTVTVISAKPYSFNQGYTFHINKETKFDGGGKMPTDKDINFRTISYSGA